MNNTPTPAPSYVDKRGAAKYSAVSVRTLDYARAGGDLPFYRVGKKKIVFKTTDLDRWLDRFRVDPTAPGAGQ